MFSSVTFSVQHMVIRTFRAGFRDMEATLDGDAGTLTGSVRVTSMDLNDPELRARLLSDEFLDADRHPTVTFVAAELRTGPGRELVAPGELTIHGVARRVEAQGRIGLAGPGLGGRDNRLGVELSATVDRRDFGLEWQEELPGGGLTLGYDVTLEAILEFVQPL